MAGHEPRGRSWTNALLIAASVIVTLLFLVYAFVWKTEADTQKKLAAEYIQQASAEVQGCVETNKTLVDSLAVLQSRLNNLEKDDTK